jgi:hypothetical protein
MTLYKIGNVEIIRYIDDLEDTLVVSSENVSECLDLIKTHNFKFLLIDKSYDKTEIDFLEECPDIEKLTIYSTTVKNFNGFSYLVNLKVLSLHVNNRVKLDIGNLLSLEEVYGELPSNTIGLSNLKKLHRMKVRSYKPPSKSLVELAELENIQELILTQSSLDSLNGIERMKHLRKLELNYIRTLHDISAIRTSNSLEMLEIESCKNIEDYSPIGSLINLEYLSLLACGSIPSIEFIKEMTKLIAFTFYNTNVVDGDLSFCEGIEDVHFTQKKHYSHRMKDFGCS